MFAGGMKGAWVMAIDRLRRMNDKIVGAFPYLASEYDMLVSEARMIGDQIAISGTADEAHYMEKLVDGIRSIPQEALTRDNAFAVLDAITHPIYDLILSMEDRRRHGR